MTRVTIIPIQQNNGRKSYLAVAGEKQSYGVTAGAAFDTIATKLGSDSISALVVQQWRPDTYFTVDQQERLSELMMRWRDARDEHRTLAAEEQHELEELIEAELLASAARAQSLLDELA